MKKNGPRSFAARPPASESFSQSSARFRESSLEALRSRRASSQSSRPFTESHHVGREARAQARGAVRRRRRLPSGARRVARRVDDANSRISRIAASAAVVPIAPRRPPRLLTTLSLPVSPLDSPSSVEPSTRSRAATPRTSSSAWTAARSCSRDATSSPTPCR
jgi:hypothetical protein